MLVELVSWSTLVTRLYGVRRCPTRSSHLVFSSHSQHNRLITNFNQLSYLLDLLLSRHELLPLSPLQPTSSGFRLLELTFLHSSSTYCLSTASVQFLSLALLIYFLTAKWLRPELLNSPLHISSQRNHREHINYTSNMASLRLTGPKLLRQLGRPALNTQFRSLHMTGAATAPRMPTADKHTQPMISAEAQAIASKATSTPSTRHFNTSRALKAVNDSSTVSLLPY